MTEERFWAIINASREQVLKQGFEDVGEILELHSEMLAKELEKQTGDEIQSFEVIFCKMLNKSYSNRLWGAAYWYNGGCSDDCFWDFRSTLISLGDEIFYRVVENPDSIADLIGKSTTPFLSEEGFQYVASQVYEKLTAKELPLNDVDAAELTDPVFDFDDITLMKQHYPKLTAVCPDMDCFDQE